MKQQTHNKSRPKRMRKEKQMSNTHTHVEATQQKQTWISCHRTDSTEYSTHFNASPRFLPLSFHETITHSKFPVCNIRPRAHTTRQIYNFAKRAVASRTLFAESSSCNFFLQDNIKILDTILLLTQKRLKCKRIFLKKKRIRIEKFFFSVRSVALCAGHRSTGTGTSSFHVCPFIEHTERMQINATNTRKNNYK